MPELSYFSDFTPLRAFLYFKGYLLLFCCVLALSPSQARALLLNNSSAERPQQLTVEQYCKQQVNPALMGAAIWYQMGVPFNLSADQLGLIPGTTAYQLAEQAFTLLQQGRAEGDIRLQLQQHCRQFSPQQLAQPQSFFAENGMTAPELSVCGDVTLSLVQTITSLEVTPVTKAAVLQAFVGEQQKPVVAKLVGIGVPLTQQGLIGTKVLEQVFAQCQQFEPAVKQQLAQEFYGH